MSGTLSIGSIGGWLFGATSQLVNELTKAVVLPIESLASAPLGDVVEPIGKHARDGANAVESLLDRILGRARSTLDNSQGIGTSVVATATFVTRRRHHGPTQLNVTIQQAMLPGPTRLQVFVDGHYHSTILAFPGQSGPIGVLLSPTAAGTHQVEIRHAGKPVGRVAVAPAENSSKQPLIDTHAPIIQLRGDASPTDLPLTMTPFVTHHADGSQTIEYRVLFSNEDAGTNTRDLLSKYGRTTDIESVYKVRLDATGTVIERKYKAPPHVWLTFSGSFDGQRPLLRVSSNNNMTSARVRGENVARWAPVPTAAVAGDLTDLQLMLRSPWSFSATSIELLREGKALLNSTRALGEAAADPRSYIYLDRLSQAAIDALKAVGGLTLSLQSGGRIFVPLSQATIERLAKRGTAILLPIQATVDAICGVAGVDATVVALTPKFAPRLLSTN